MCPMVNRIDGFGPGYMNACEYSLKHWNLCLTVFSFDLASDWKGKFMPRNNKKRSHTQLDSRKQVIAFQDRVITINIKEAQHPLK